MLEPQIRAASERDAGVPPFSAISWALLLVVVVCGACYAGVYLKRGWFPHDEGAFGLMAEHTLHGELPHRDFDEIYTGGLSYLNAAAMGVFGENLVSMRYPVYGAFVIWTAVVFALARRFVSDGAAAITTLLLIAISYPNYTAAVPSWYNLFFATLGAWALFRFTESGRLLWVFVAGLWGGLSFLVKVPGLYYVAAALCFLLFHEQEEDRTENQGSRILPFGIAGLGIGFVLLVWRTIGWRIEPRYIVHFVLPSAAVMGVLVWREFHGAYASDRQRLTQLVQLASVLLAGVILPIALYLIPYVRSGSLHSFLEGVFVLPFRRVGFAAQAPEHLDALLPSVCLVALLLYAMKGARSRLFQAGVAILIAALIVLSGGWRPAYHILWSAVTLLIPLSVLVVVWLLSRSDYSALHRKRIFLLTAVVAIGSLVRFPFASPIYLLYVLPLVPLLWVAIASGWPQWSRFVYTVVAIGYIGFFAWRVTPSFITNMGIRYQPVVTAKLDLARAGGVRVPPENQRVYEEVARLVAQHAKGDYIYAAPDCPQIYFLTAKRQTDPVMFDFFDTDRQLHRERVLSELGSHSVNLVVILNRPAFSPPMNQDLREQLNVRYPEAKRVGDFEVRWSE